MKKLILRAFVLVLAAVMLLTSVSLAETLRRGDKGDNVIALQTGLSQLGYYTGKIDGKFGAGTLKAVKAFQKAESLKVDGLAGKSTQAALTDLTGVVFEEEDVILIHCATREVQYGHSEFFQTINIGSLSICSCLLQFLSSKSCHFLCTDL